MAISKRGLPRQRQMRNLRESEGSVNEVTEVVKGGMADAHANGVKAGRLQIVRELIDLLRAIALEELDGEPTQRQPEQQRADL